MSEDGISARQQYNRIMFGLAATAVPGGNPTGYLVLPIPPNGVPEFVLGPSFGTLPVGQQMTVFIHEMEHRPGKNPNLNLAQSNAEIMSLCGTDMPTP